MSPIRPENRDPGSHWHAPLSQLITPDEHAAIELMRHQFGADPSRTYQFWEHLTARMLDGRTTPAGCGWDVETGPTRVEVKFSQEFTTHFAGQPRQVFRWVGLHRDDADAVALFGVDPADRVYLWVAPPSELSGSATVTSPRTRVGGTRSPIDVWHVPVDQLLPAVLRCHLHYDRDHHAQTRAATRAAALATQMDPLFDTTHTEETPA